VVLLEALEGLKIKLGAGTGPLIFWLIHLIESLRTQGTPASLPRRPSLLAGDTAGELVELLTSATPGTSRYPDVFARSAGKISEWTWDRLVLLESLAFASCHSPVVLACASVIAASTDGDV